MILIAVFFFLTLSLSKIPCRLRRPTPRYLAKSSTAWKSFSCHSCPWEITQEKVTILTKQLQDFLTKCPTNFSSPPDFLNLTSTVVAYGPFCDLGACCSISSQLIPFFNATYSQFCSKGIKIQYIEQVPPDVEMVNDQKAVVTMVEIIKNHPLVVNQVSYIWKRQSKCTYWLDSIIYNVRYGACAV